MFKFYKDKNAKGLSVTLFGHGFAFIKTEKPKNHLSIYKF